MDKSRIEAHIKPLLGKRIVSTLKLGDIEGAQADIVAGKTSKPRTGSRGGVTTGGEGVASRTMSTLHAIFEHAVRLGKIGGNPARGVRKIASKPRKRRLSRAEIEYLGRAMLAAKKDGEHPTGLAAIRFLLLTGFRRMEGLGLERAWLDEEEGAIRFPDTKSGAQIRIIGQPAVDLLLAQPRTKSPFFFPADWGDGHFIGVVRVFDRICARVGLEDVTLHTLRHTFASVAADLGFSELTIAALLGHAAHGVTQRYIHIDEALQLAADKVTDEITSILDQSGRGRRSRRSARENDTHVSAT
jgi:integrase